MGNIMIVHFVGLYPPNNLVLFFMYFINYPEVYCSVGQIFRDFVEEESRFRFSNFLGGYLSGGHNVLDFIILMENNVRMDT